VTLLRELITTVHGRVAVALDEGGVRCTWRGGAAHVPWSGIADVSIVESLFGRPLMAIVGRAGDEMRLRLEHADPVDLHRAMLVQLAERRSRSAAGEPPESFARDGRRLGAWLAAAASILATPHAYRAGGVDRARLEAVLADDHAGVSPRAAAAHALLASGDDDELARAAKAFVLRALPPLVLVAARLAPGGAALVDDDVFAESVAFLPADDRADATRLAERGRDAAREARVAATLERAKAEALDELRAAQASSATASRWRRAPRELAPGGGGERWVGRTWSL
jgi:hypothetical protein